MLTWNAEAASFASPMEAIKLPSGFKVKCAAVAAASVVPIVVAPAASTTISK